MRHQKFFEESLDVPNPPEIFKTNVLLIQNKRSILLWIFFILVIPFFLLTIDVRQDGPTFVDLNIRRFRLERKIKLDEEGNEYISSFGVFSDQDRKPETSKMILERKSLVENVTIGVTVCEMGVLENAIVSIKSVVLSALNYRVQNVNVHIFVDSVETGEDIKLDVHDIQSSISKTSLLTFKYKIHQVSEVFPREHFKMWMRLHKKCSSLHLFLPNSIPEVGEILYLDADTLVLGDIRELWSLFRKMDSRQFAGLTLDQADGNFASFYQANSRVPFVPPTGVITGVMLLNLTRMRQYDWDVRVNNALEWFSHDFLRGAQDIVNILFYFNREYLQLLPCIFNYHRGNCKIVQHCNIASSHPEGIQVLHGTSDTFEYGGDFREIYEQFQKFDLSHNDFRKDIVLPVKWHYRKLELSKRTFDSGCTVIGRRIFNSWLDSEIFFKKRLANRTKTIKITV